MTATARGKLTAAYGASPPLWLVTLAGACDRRGLAAVAQQLGRSKTMLSQAINGRYPGDMARLEALVRAHLLAERVACPVVGLIAATACLEHQGRGFSTASPETVKLSRACPTCPHAQATQTQGGRHV